MNLFTSTKGAAALPARPEPPGKESEVVAVVFVACEAAVVVELSTSEAPFALAVPVAVAKEESTETCRKCSCISVSEKS